VNKKISDGSFGNELSKMLDGQKPIAIFYRAVGESFDPTDGQEFEKHVRAGEIVKTKFFISNEGQKFSIFYVVYTIPGEEWRANLYKIIKKIGQHTWGKDLEFIEARILGY
jgi:hypothetical protein